MAAYSTIPKIRNNKEIRKQEKMKSFSLSIYIYKISLRHNPK